ncbi:hypothetical protein [Brachyspira alvinipulli]|uniref:hypothetical protein n=1 Tax=Brachyspira alvinipulli TaxID=84379 RepID=UPI0004855BB0|nr:hypothetical protein [Brachyspira alvinipulli]
MKTILKCFICLSLLFFISCGSNKDLKLALKNHEGDDGIAEIEKFVKDKKFYEAFTNLLKWDILT